MRKSIMACTAIAGLSAILAGCGWNAVNTVGSTFVRAGTGVVSTTGMVVGRTVSNGVDILVGRPVSYQDISYYRKYGVIYHNGYAYRVVNGKYVLVR